jgi:hypothetical protein
MKRPRSRRSRAKKPLPGWREDQQEIIELAERVAASGEPNPLLDAVINIAKLAPLPKGRPRKRIRSIDGWRKTQEDKRARADREQVYVPLREKFPLYVDEERQLVPSGLLGPRGTKSTSLVELKKKADKRCVKEAQAIFTAMGFKVSRRTIEREGHFSRK